MREKPTASPAFGMELNPIELKGAVLSMRQGRPQLDFLVRLAIDRHEGSPLHVKLLYTPEENKKLHAMADRSLVVTALPTSHILVRPLELQLTKDSDIDAVLDFQAEPLLPYPLDDAAIDSVTLKKEAEGTKLALLATRNDAIGLHLEQWLAIGIEPEVVACVPSALASFASFFLPSEVPSLILHLGYMETSCILIVEGKLNAAASCPIGVSQLLNSFSQDTKLTDETADTAFSNIDFSEVDAKRFPALHDQMNAYRLETKRIVYALSKSVHGNIDKLCICGEGGTLKNLPEALCKGLDHPLAVPTEKPGFEVSTEDLQKYSVVIGLALSSLPKAKDRINFRQKALAYPKPWKRLTVPIATYLALCFVTAGALYLFGNAYIARQEDKLRQQYVDLLTMMRKPYNTFEQQLKGHAPEAGKPAPAEEIAVLSLTQQQIQERVNVLEKEIGSSPETFPLFPNIPKVSDVLAWLTAYSTKIGKEVEPPATGTPKMQIESFSYKVVKRPEQNKPRDKYQAKVEMEFTVSSPRYAREFHDMLIAPNEMVDPAEEVKWSAEASRYRASFLLKDRTYYPSLRTAK